MHTYTQLHEREHQPVGCPPPNMCATVGRPSELDLSICISSLEAGSLCAHAVSWIRVTILSGTRCHPPPQPPTTTAHHHCRK
mmetsp:Transcript_76105/g.150865  ORF Transcript_76105/g.150865 Transcript_76105/m.150865 type:complete len:82 (-) Transcript_76105:1246-1491(-)